MKEKVCFLTENVNNLKALCHGLSENGFQLFVFYSVISLRAFGV